MTNKSVHPKLCVVFFPPYEQKLGRRPPGIMLAHTHAETLQQMMIACAQSLPHKELTRAGGAGDFFVGHETDFDISREPSEYQDLVAWCGMEKSGHYLEFLRGRLKPYFTTANRV